MIAANILINKGQVDTFILDFEKASNTPTHELLIYSFKVNCSVIELVEQHLNG